MTILRVFLICLFGMAFAQGLPKAEDIQTTVQVRRLEDGKLRDLGLIKKGQVLAYLIRVKTGAYFASNTLALRADLPKGATLLPDRTKTSKYRFFKEYSTDGKTFQQKAPKGWKFMRVVISDPVPQGAVFELRLVAKVN